MLPKAHLTSHSRMSGSSDHTIMVIWVIEIFFLYTSSVYSCHLYLISSASVRSVPFLSFPVPILCSLGISNFLEEISSLFHSTVSLYFFALITEEGFLISPRYSLELWIEMDISFLLPFASLLFSAICKSSSDYRFAFFVFLFLGDGFDHGLLYNVMNLHP